MSISLSWLFLEFRGVQGFGSQVHGISGFADAHASTEYIFVLRVLGVPCISDMIH